MFALTSVSLFILNLTFSIIASKKIATGTYFSRYKPRFDFIFIMIWGYIPLSFASAITDTFFLETLNKNYHYCIFFSILKHMAFISFFAPPFLAIYFFLVMFTKIGKDRVNMIGNILFGFLFIFITIRTFYMTGYLPVKKIEKLENGIYGECSCSDRTINNFFYYFASFIQIIVLAFIFFVIGYEKYLDMYRSIDDKRSKFSRVHMIKSFMFIFFTSLGLLTIPHLIKKIDFASKLIYYISVDLKRCYPFFYSLIIIYCDQPITLDLKFYCLEVIFDIPELRKIFENFLHEKGSKRMKNLVSKFQSLLKANEKEEKGETDFKERNGEYESIIVENELDPDVLEKEIFLEGLSEFYLSNEFIYFLYKFQNTGIIELEMELNRN